MRLTCGVCHYPAKTCICKYIHPVFNLIDIVILQHPKEASHAKNTVRLLQLALNNIQVHVGKQSADFTSLQQQLHACSKHTVVVYPSPESTELTSTYLLENPLKIERMILIDGSWKQAYGIWKRNPWLNRFAFIKLPANLTGCYEIRKIGNPNALSTLEATAHCLDVIEKIDTSSLSVMLSAFQQHWLRYQ